MTKTISDILPAGQQSIDFHVDNFHDSVDPDTPLTDATLRWEVFNEAGVSQGGTTMTHIANGNYRGKGNFNLTDGSKYRVVISDTQTYRCTWTKWFIARTRPFSM